jgi:pimeloyl-ACP methyl ester carboxylesterase
MFGNELVDDGTFPREWAERLYDVHRWTVMPSGGHFAAMEEPDALASDISTFFGGLPR